MNFTSTSIRFRSHLILLFLLGLLFVPGGELKAEVMQHTYIARLGKEDHFNSAGVRLTSVAAILRQDRANYHLGKSSDELDQHDPIFHSKKNRAVLEQMLKRGRVSRALAARIINGTPLVRVTLLSEDGKTWGIFLQEVGFDAFPPDAG